MEVLQPGYSRAVPGGCRANGSCSLVRGPGLVLLVDTLSAWDRQLLTAQLGDRGVRPDQATGGNIGSQSTPGPQTIAGLLCIFIFASHRTCVLLLERCQVTHVVCTHGHPDHVGNNNLFTGPGVQHLVGWALHTEDLYTDTELQAGQPVSLAGDQVRQDRCEGR